MNLKRSKKNVRWIIIGVIIAAAIVGMSLLKIDEDIVFFLTPVEAQAKAAELKGKTIRVGGMVKTGSVQWNAEKLALHFIVSDLDTVEIQVSHTGSPPDLFKEGAGVVVAGPGPVGDCPVVVVCASSGHRAGVVGGDGWR